MKDVKEVYVSTRTRILSTRTLVVLANDVYENMSAINENNGKSIVRSGFCLSFVSRLDPSNANLLSTQEQNKNST